MMGERREEQMSIRTILVPFDGTEAAKPALETALAVGREIDAHVEVVHVSVDAKDMVPLLGEGMSGAMIEEMLALAEKESAGRAKKARRMFDEACAGAVPIVEPPAEGAGQAGFSVTWAEQTGREDEIIGNRSRSVDLVIVARTTPDSDASAALTLKAALFESGHPVLVATATAAGTAPVLGTRVAIAWNGSVQAARAVTAAIPFLRRAGGVTILTADSIRTSVDVVPALIDYLGWHGVAAEARTSSPAGRHVGEVMLKECVELGAELLVMGAYTHSRMRQLILGGVTRYVLAEAKIPLFMAH